MIKLNVRRLNFHPISLSLFLWNYSSSHQSLFSLQWKQFLCFLFTFKQVSISLIQRYYPLVGRIDTYGVPNLTIHFVYTQLPVSFGILSFHFHVIITQLKKLDKTNKSSSKRLEIPCNQDRKQWNVLRSWCPHYYSILLRLSYHYHYGHLISILLRCFKLYRLPSAEWL